MFDNAYQKVLKTISQNGSLYDALKMGEEMAKYSTPNLKKGTERRVKVEELTAQHDNDVAQKEILSKLLKLAGTW